MGVFQFGSLLVILSDSLVSGFTCGSAFHVLTSQVKSLFDLNIPKQSGVFKIIRVSLNLKYIFTIWINCLFVESETFLPLKLEGILTFRRFIFDGDY